MRCLNVVNFTMIGCFLSFLSSKLFPGLFPTFHPFHMECWLFVDRPFDCIVHCIQPKARVFFIFLGVLNYSLSLFLHASETN